MNPQEMKIITERYRIFTTSYNYLYDLGREKIFRYKGNSDAHPKEIKLEEPLEDLESFKKLIGIMEQL